MANRRWITRISVATLGGTLGLGMAFAQDGAPTPAAPPSGESEVEVSVGPNQSGDDQRAQVEQIMQRGSSISARLTAVLDEARRSGDIIMVTCVNNKLTQVNAQLRNAEVRARALEVAWRGNDASGAAHEYTVLVVIGQKLTSLEREANQCVGQDIFSPGGASQVDSTVDPGTAGGQDGMKVTIGDTGVGTVAPPPADIPPPASAT